jgi:hypothetical protein
MTKDIQLSNNKTLTGCWLVVRNVTGLAEERGFRLYWTNDDQHLVPALGLATSSPFRTMRDAVWYGERQGWGKAKRIKG